MMILRGKRYLEILNFKISKIFKRIEKPVNEAGGKVDWCVRFHYFSPRKWKGRYLAMCAGKIELPQSLRRECMEIVKRLDDDKLRTVKTISNTF